MKTTIIKDEIIEKLEENSISFLIAGLDLLEQKLNGSKPDSCFLSVQTIIANLCIAIELMLKTIIARDAFAFLYESLPDELFMELAYPEACKCKSNSHVIEMQKFNTKYKTIDFNKSVERFIVIFPETRKVFHSYLSEISQIRNQSVHACIPKATDYYIFYALYTALELYQFLREQGLYEIYPLEIDASSLLKIYEDDKVTRVKRAIATAQNTIKGKFMDDKEPDVLEDWEHYAIHCPICNAEAIVEGFTDFDNDDSHIFLTFYSGSFECYNCGLKLLDIQELKIAGIEITYDRSDEKNSWIKEHQEELK